MLMPRPSRPGFQTTSHDHGRLAGRAERGNRPRLTPQTPQPTMTARKRNQPRGQLMNTAAESHNMRLIGHHDLDGFGNGGEGLGIQRTKDGRRFIYIAHESAPKNFTVVEITDPR